MNIYAKDFRRLLRLSVVSLSVASINGLTTNAEAQQVATGYADAIVLPKYYPGMGRVMVLGGIESARSSITSETVSHTQTARPSSGDNKLTVQANVTPDQPNQVKVVVVQQPSTGSSVIPAPTDSPQIVLPAPALPPKLAAPSPSVSPKLIAPQTAPPQPPKVQTNGVDKPSVIEPNQDSELQRRSDERNTDVSQPREFREVQPQRDQPQLRRDQPRVVQGFPLNPVNRDQPNRNEDRVLEERRAPTRDNDNEWDSRPQGDRDSGPRSRRPDGNRQPDPQAFRESLRDGGPGFNPGAQANQGPNQGQGPWMRGGMDGAPSGGDFGRPNNGPGPNNWAGPNNGPGRNGPNNGLAQDLDSMDRIFNSPAVRQFLQMKEENLQLKAELKMKERELEMKMEMTEMRLRMHMQDAEKRVDQANQQLAEMKERAEREKQPVQERRLMQGAARPDIQPVQQLLHDLQMREKELASNLGEEHPNVVALRKRIALEQEQSESQQRPRENTERAAGKEREESQKSLERVTQERNRVVAELENVLKQSADLKHKLDAVAQEKSNMEKALIDAKRSAEMQVLKAQQAARQAAEEASKREAKQAAELAARAKREAEAQKAYEQIAEMKKDEVKKAEAARKADTKKEKSATRKKPKDKDEQDDSADEVDEE